jgi:hypothetical protein
LWPRLNQVDFIANYDSFNILRLAESLFDEDPDFAQTKGERDQGGRVATEVDLGVVDDLRRDPRSVGHLA